MNTKSAMSAAAALVLVVAGGASALQATRSPAGTPQPSVNDTTATTVVIEYVDENGNPVAAPGQAPIEVRSLETAGAPAIAAATEPEIIWIDAAPGTSAASTANAVPPAGATSYDDDHESEYDDDHEYEHEDHDEYEHEEHEDHEDD